MGMFDSVYVRCWCCDASLEFQSKAGPCILKVYAPSEVPAEIAQDLDGESKRCSVCGNWTKLTNRRVLVSTLEAGQ